MQIVRCGLLFMLALGACFSPQFDNRDISCGPNDECPPGLQCFGDLCRAEDPGVATLTVTRGGSGMGAVVSTPSGINCGATCSQTYALGTSVTLVATPDATTTEFRGWGVAGCADSSSSCTLTVNADTTVATTFALESRVVTVVPAGNGTGTVTSSVGGINCPGTCSASVDHGTVVTLTGTAVSPSSFLGWAGGGCSGTGTCVVTATSDVTVNAPFAIGNTLVVMKSGNGAATGTVTALGGGINCGIDCMETYAQGTVVTLNASVSTGTVFTGWTGATCAGTGSCLVTLNQATSITAQFDLNVYALSITKTGNAAASGTVTAANTAEINCGADCAESYTHGTMVTLTATAPTGTTFNGWTGGGCSGTSTCVVPMTMTTTVAADFSISRYTLTAVKGGPAAGTINGSSGVTQVIGCPGDCTEIVDHGTVVTLTAVTPSGSRFMGWTGGGCSGMGSCVVTLTANTTVTGTFEVLTQHMLTLKTIGGGSGSVNSCTGTCTSVHDFGTVITLTPSAASSPASAASVFTGWTGGGCTGTGACTITITADEFVSANFELRPNFVFVTSTPDDANFGGLAGADAICQAHAIAGSIPGTFKAWLSGSASSDSAALRIGAASGWVRKDNNPAVWPPDRPWALNQSDLLDGKQHYTLTSELGTSLGSEPVVTATNVDGSLNGSTCSDWSVADGTFVTTGVVTGYGDLWTSFGGQTCDSTNLHLTCLGVDRAANLPALPAPTGPFRRAFATANTYFPGSGITGADQFCATEATAAGLTGTFRALLATNGFSAASRFNATTGGPWFRVDNTRIAPNTMIFTTPFWDAAINVTANGASYLGGGATVWTGAATPMASGVPSTTCNNWMQTTGSGGNAGRAGTSDVITAFNSGLLNCQFGHQLYCLEI